MRLVAGHNELYEAYVLGGTQPSADRTLVRAGLGNPVSRIRNMAVKTHAARMAGIHLAA